MKKSLIIKFWGKLGDTTIGINQILLRNDPKNFIFCFQNKLLLSRLHKKFNTENIEMPEIKYSFKNIIIFSTFLIKLFFKRKYIKDIYILEGNISIFYKIIRRIFFNKKIHFIQNNIINEYKRIGNLFKYTTKEKFLSLPIIENKSVSFLKGKQYIVIGLWSETWKWRSPNSKYRGNIISEIELSVKWLDYIILIGKWNNDLCLSNEIIQENQNQKIINLVDKTNIEELGELLSNAKLNIMIDSWLAHFAHLFCPPEIMIFGPDSPDRRFPEWYKNRYTVYNKQICSPCEQNWNSKDAQCKIGTGVCLNNISIEKKIKAIIDIIF